MEQAEKARIAKVAIGSQEIEGLMLSNGDYAVGVPQVAELFSLAKDHASREVKALLGKDFQFNKVKSELHSKEVNIISLGDFKKVVIELAIKGNKKAVEFGRLMMGLSLQQLFCDASGVKFETKERQQWVRFREERKDCHPKLDIWFKADGCEGAEYGNRMNQFKAHLGLPLISTGEYTEDQLDKLKEAEIEYHALRRIGLPHSEALKYIK